MQYCVDHPEEISKIAKVKAQVSEVKGVMMENIEKVFFWMNLLIFSCLSLVMWGGSSFFGNGMQFINKLFAPAGS